MDGATYVLAKKSNRQVTKMVISSIPLAANVGLKVKVGLMPQKS